MRSTKPASAAPDEAAGQVYRSPPNNEKLGDNVAKLESDLAMEREQRAEERFIWITTVAVLGDFIAYGMLRDFFGFALIFLLELIVLAIVARRLGVDWAVQLIGWVMFHVSRRAAPEPPSEDVKPALPPPRSKPAPKKTPRP